MYKRTYKLILILPGILNKNTWQIMEFSGIFVLTWKIGEFLWNFIKTQGSL